MILWVVMILIVVVKVVQELITKSFRKSFFNSDHENNIGLASVRAGNVIGGGDWAENRLIPDIIRAIKNKENVKNSKSKGIKTMATCIGSTKWIH